jgi:hypothetical protein
MDRSHEAGGADDEQQPDEEVDRGAALMEALMPWRSEAIAMTTGANPPPIQL